MKNMHTTSYHSVTAHTKDDKAVDLENYTINTIGYSWVFSHWHQNILYSYHVYAERITKKKKETRRSKL